MSVPFTNAMMVLAMAVIEPYKKLGSIGPTTPDLDRFPNLDLPGSVFAEIPETEEKSFSEVLSDVFPSCTSAIPAIGDKFKISPVIKRMLTLPADNAYALFCLAPS